MYIGNVEIKGKAVLAPMAGVSDKAFRELCMGYGAAYAVTEMVSSKGLSFNSKKSAELMELSPNEIPCGIQIFGSEPNIMADAARFALRYKPQIIDINMGCPAPKISSNGSGASLMKNPKLCGDIVKAVCSAVDIPVTVKIRKGWDEDSVNAVEVAQICEYNGASAITVHGRTRMQYYLPPVDIDIIKSVKQAVKIPVIGNGDITSPIEAENMINNTGCDLVMIGRGALGNPWLFRQINAYFDTDKLIPLPTLEERMITMVHHIENMCKYKGEIIGMREARKHIAYYFKGMHGAAELRKKSGTVCTLQDLYNLVKEAFIAQQVHL